jgi:hypothetical protein
VILPLYVAPLPIVDSTRHALRRWVAARPGVYLPLARWKNEHSALDADTQLVIDGFTRSAGTFAAVAFQFAQNDHVRVAHHMHAVAPLLVAARRQIPVLLAVREPESTVLSASVREPNVTVRQWLKTYVDFYDRIVTCRDDFVVATFEEVTSDLGGVIRRVNDRFGTRFREFEHTPPNVESVFTLIDERAEGAPWQPFLNRFVSGLLSLDEYRAATEPFRRSAAGAPAVPELRVQRPTARREAAKDLVRVRYLDPALSSLRASAERAYRSVAA